MGVWQAICNKRSMQVTLNPPVKENDSLGKSPAASSSPPEGSFLQIFSSSAAEADGMSSPSTNSVPPAIPQADKAGGSVSRNVREKSEKESKLDKVNDAGTLTAPMSCTSLASSGVAWHLDPGTLTPLPNSSNANSVPSAATQTAFAPSTGSMVAMQEQPLTAMSLMNVPGKVSSAVVTGSRMRPSMTEDPTQVHSSSTEDADPTQAPASPVVQPDPTTSSLSAASAAALPQFVSLLQEPPNPQRILTGVPGTERTANPLASRTSDRTDAAPVSGAKTQAVTQETLPGTPASMQQAAAASAISLTTSFSMPNPEASSPVRAGNVSGGIKTPAQSTALIGGSDLQVSITASPAPVQATGLVTEVVNRSAPTAPKDQDDSAIRLPPAGSTGMSTSQASANAAAPVGASPSGSQSASSTSNNADAVNAQVPAASPEPSGVVTAHLLQNLSKSEMQVHVNAQEFGRVSIHATYGRGALSTEISLENADLRSALSAQLPSLEQKLGQDHGLRSSITVNNLGNGQGTAGDGRQGQTDAPPQRRAYERSSTSINHNGLDGLTTPSPGLAHANLPGSNRLDIRI